MFTLYYIYFSVTLCFCKCLGRFQEKEFLFSFAFKANIFILYVKSVAFGVKFHTLNQI